MGDTLRVELKSGETITFENDDWDDFEYNFGMLVVKSGNGWAAAFNMREVRYFIVEESKDNE